MGFLGISGPSVRRLEEERYGLVGGICNNCGKKEFPAVGVCGECTGSDNSFEVGSQGKGVDHVLAVAKLGIIDGVVEGTHVHGDNGHKGGNVLALVLIPAMQDFQEDR